MIDTARLTLRRWRETDRAAFARLNAEFGFPRPLTRAESDALIADFEARRVRDGFCFAAIERRSDGAFLGMAGLARCTMDAAFCPCVEIGWMLDRAHWSQGYATEAARGWLAHGLGPLGLPEIVAFTDCTHAASIAVMRRAGMRPDPSRAFDHPDLPPGDPIRPHILYALAAADWRASA